MFGSKKNDIQDHLIKKGYDIKEFMNKNGDWYYFKVSTTWSGVHTVKVKDGLFGYSIEKVSN